MSTGSTASVGDRYGSTGFALAMFFIGVALLVVAVAVSCAGYSHYRSVNAGLDKYAGDRADDKAADQSAGFRRPTMEENGISMEENPSDKDYGHKQDITQV